MKPKLLGGEGKCFADILLFINRLSPCEGCQLQKKESKVEALRNYFMRINLCPFPMLPAQASTNAKGKLEIASKRRLFKEFSFKADLE